MFEQHIYWLLSQCHKQILTKVLDETEFSFFRCRFCLEDVYFAQNSLDIVMICFDVLRNISPITLNYRLKIIKYYQINNNKQNLRVIYF